jgi:hypothetical protein
MKTEPTEKEYNLRREMQLLNADIYRLRLEKAELEKQLTLYNVTQQRELLIAWERHNQFWEYGNFDTARIEEVDDWLSNL